MHLIDIIIILAISASVIFALVHARKNKGKCCGNCSGCSGMCHDQRHTE